LHADSKTDLPLLGKLFSYVVFSRTRKYFPPVKFSDTLAGFMEMRGVSAPELARVLNVTPHAVNHWLRGDTRPTAARLELIAVALGIDAAFLLGPPPSAGLVVNQPSDNFSQTPEELAWLHLWRRLDNKQREKITAFIELLVPELNGN